jgi:hypothetical protein
MFAPTAATTLHGEGIDSVKNTVLLAHDVHSLMGSLMLWFEVTEVKDTYTRAAQTGVFDLDIRVSNRLFINVCTSYLRPKLALNPETSKKE